MIRSSDLKDKQRSTSERQAKRYARTENQKASSTQIVT